MAIYLILLLHICNSRHLSAAHGQQGFRGLSMPLTPGDGFFIQSSFPTFW